MVGVETAEMIARRRLVSAEALLEGRADLNGYPFQLLGVVSQRGVGMDSLGAVVAAAEMLLSYRWDVVSVAEFTNSNHACALMRRRARP